MEAKCNKALDYNKLLMKQAKGKELTKELRFPLLAPLKYDGNYVVVIVELSGTTFITSGGLTYTHTDNGGAIFDNVMDGVYLAERIYDKGLLGQRNKCNLRGPKTSQTSTGHTYKVFDYLTLDEYNNGYSVTPYHRRRELLTQYIEDHSNLATEWVVSNREQLDKLLDEVVKNGYEGLILRDIDHKWKHHKTSRRIDLCKYKKRPTVDLLCIDVKEGTGKYVGMIGSLILTDKIGRIVSTGSGMSDEDRLRDPEYFIGNVVEVFYEQIVDTYIQPTFGDEYEGVLIRHDKTKEEID